MGFWAYLIGIFVGGAICAWACADPGDLVSVAYGGVNHLSFASGPDRALNAFMAATIGFENFASGAAVSAWSPISRHCAICASPPVQYALISAGASVVSRFITGTSAGALISPRAVCSSIC